MEFPYSPIVGFAKAVFAVQGLRFTIIGEDHVPLSGGAVMAINHTGYLDFAYAGYAAQQSRRLVRFMAKQSVFSHPVAGPLMRSMGHIPVDRKAGAASFAQAVEALQAGEIVGLFPEATMSRSFELKQFKPGAVRLAIAAGVPVLPTTVWGSQRVWTKELPKHLGRSRIPMHVTIGAPMVFAEGTDEQQATTWLRDLMQAQLDAQQAAYPPLTGTDLAYLPARLGGTAPTPEESHQQDLHDMTRTVDKFNRAKRAR